MLKLIVIASLFVFSVTNGAVSISDGPSVDEKFPYICYHPGYKLYIPRGGKVQSPWDCAEINCSDNLKITEYSCGATVYDTKTCVKLPEDLSQPYPYCCSQIKC